MSRLLLPFVHIAYRDERVAGIKLVCLISANTSMLSGLGGSNKPPSSHTSPWLSCEAAKHRLEITNLLPENLMPVNSLDIAATTLLAGTDGEQIYTIKNISIA